MAGKFERKRFSEIDLNDSFFDSLKADYPGTSSSTGFVQWFTKKAVDGKRALVFEDDQGVGAFVNLKPGETEEIKLADGSVYRRLRVLKSQRLKLMSVIVIKGLVKVRLG